MKIYKNNYIYSLVSFYFGLFIKHIISYSKIYLSTYEAVGAAWDAIFKN